MALHRRYLAGCLSFRVQLGGVVIGHDLGWLCYGCVLAVVRVGCREDEMGWVSLHGIFVVYSQCSHFSLVASLLEARVLFFFFLAWFHVVQRAKNITTGARRVWSSPFVAQYVREALNCEAIVCCMYIVLHTMGIANLGTRKTQLLDVDAVDTVDIGGCESRPKHERCLPAAPVCRVIFAFQGVHVLRTMSTSSGNKNLPESVYWSNGTLERKVQMCTYVRLVPGIVRCQYWNRAMSYKRTPCGYCWSPSLSKFNS